MKVVQLSAFVLLISSIAGADTLVLSDGKSIEWKTLVDKGDSLDVTTTDGKIVTVKKSDVARMVFNTDKGPLTGATFSPENKKSGQPTNLLTIVNPKKDAVNGDWRFAGGALVGRSPQADAAYRIAIPFSPPEEYDLDIIAEIKDGDGEILIGLVAWGKQFAVHFDHGRGLGSGLSQVDGAWASQNDTGKPGRVFVKSKPRAILVSVRKEFLSVKLDGQPWLYWKGDPKRLSLIAAHRPENAEHLFVSIANASYSISKFAIIPKK